MLRSCKLQPLQTLSAALAPASPGGDLLEEENLDVKKKKRGHGNRAKQRFGAGALLHALWLAQLWEKKSWAVGFLRGPSRRSHLAPLDAARRAGKQHPKPRRAAIRGQREVGGILPFQHRCSCSPPTCSAELLGRSRTRSPHPVTFLRVPKSSSGAPGFEEINPNPGQEALARKAVPSACLCGPGMGRKVIPPSEITT